MLNLLISKTPVVCFFQRDDPPAFQNFSVLNTNPVREGIFWRFFNNLQNLTRDLFTAVFEAVASIGRADSGSFFLISNSHYANFRSSAISNKSVDNHESKTWLLTKGHREGVPQPGSMSEWFKEIGLNPIVQLHCTAGSNPAASAGFLAESDFFSAVETTRFWRDRIQSPKKRFFKFCQPCDPFFTSTQSREQRRFMRFFLFVWLVISSLLCGPSAFPGGVSLQGTDWTESPAIESAQLRDVQCFSRVCIASVTRARLKASWSSKPLFEGSISSLDTASSSLIRQSRAFVRSGLNVRVFLASPIGMRSVLSLTVFL